MNSWINNVLATPVYGTNIPLQVIGVATIAIFVLFFLAIWLNTLLISFLKKLISFVPGETKTRLSDRLTGFAPSLYLLVIILIVLSVVSMQNSDYGWLTQNTWFRLFSFIGFISVIFGISRITPVFVSLYLHNRDRIDRKVDQPIDPTIRSLFVIVFNIVLYVFAVFESFDLLAIRPTSLVAGASVTAIILGFALQNVLSDIFSSFSLYLDQPFRVGDTIKVGNETGRVLSIGFKTTRLKTLHGEELTISNAELTKTQIKNLERLKKRRVEIMIELDKKASFDHIQLFPGLVKMVIDIHKELEYKLCNLVQIHEKTYQYLLAYDVLVPSYTRHHELKEILLTELILACQNQKIEIMKAE